MPPPLLPRHLRPCHPSWRAHRLRRASSTPSTPRVKLPAPSDDQPERSSTDCRDETGEAREQKSWWSAAVASVSSFGYRSPLEESQAEPTQSPADAEPAPTIRIGRHEQRRAKQARPFRIARHASSKGAASPLAYPIMKSVKLTPDDASEVRSEETNQVASFPNEAVPNVDNTDQKAIARQLQHLLQQVKMLQEALVKSQSNHAPSPQPVVGRTATSTSGVTHTAETKSAPKTSAKPLSTRTSTPSTPLAARHTVRSLPRSEEVRQLARHGYRRSTTELAKIAQDLEKDMSRVGKPIVSLIRKRLALIARDALEYNDRFMARAVQAHRGPSIRPLIHKELGFSELANVYYRRMAIALVKIAGTLESLRSPAASHITSMARDRLRAMAEEAESENDERMRQALKGAQDYYIRHNLDRSDGFTRTKSMNPPSAKSSDQQLAALVSSSHVRFANTSVTRFNKVATSNQLSQDQEDLTNAANSSSSLHGSANNTTSATQTAERISGKQNRLKRLVHQIHTQSRLMKSSSDHANVNAPSNAQKETPLLPPKSSADANPASEPQDVRPSGTMPTSPKPQEPEEISEQSLLEELFPEVSTTPITREDEKREKYQKLEPPASNKLISREIVDTPRTLKEQVFESFHKTGEQVTVLQLEHCSTELTEIDFRRLVPKGKHLEGWNLNGEFLKVIPGRDPLSLERLPFYYLLFKTPESAHAYQNNATRIHKLAALHQPSSILSAIPPPRGFLEDGEDISALSASYVLKPKEHPMTLRTLMQPYHPALRALIEQGGYNPIVPDVDDKGNRIHKVLMHIEGYEPSRSDLFKIFRRDAYHRGLALSLRNEVSSSIHRLRDIINLKTHMQPISTTNPRAFSHWESNELSSMKLEFDDPAIAYLMKSDMEGEGDATKTINQIVMNRVYNRWLIEFDDEDEARRFAVAWHRRPLPELFKGDRTWKDYEEVRMCNCEVLW